MGAGRLALIGAAVALVLAAALGGATLWTMSAGEPAAFEASRARVEDAVRTIVDHEQAAMRDTGEFQPFTFEDVDQDRQLMGLPWRGFPIADYRFEAQLMETGNLRVRAVPKPESVQDREVAAQFYVAETTPGGELVETGWRPE